ncbi:ATP synthase F1 subunit gamma [Sedimentibacter sp. zth1]|uniref:ATP synthase F1 subunit gamma n=1 Tax=Sedimentibacter sp. zth1 TaxID=2816908 RepID=UPI001A92C397|nr:ATP synthase F1 subunit gamma [Sedimentibacter sp. zth1]QSX05043.1 ATP synthase F1 subunit gamma [Sedimentibacter sp. zth1]
MPQGLNDIKRRIKSVNSTMQITKAMELVSTAKLKRARVRLEKSKPYFESTLESIKDVLANTKGVRHPFIEKREVKNTLYVLITSDKGLAGGYNANVCKLLQNEIKSKDTAKIIAIGVKGRDFFRRRGYDVIESITGVSETPDAFSAKLVGDKAIELYKTKEVDEIKIIYTQFKSTISYIPEIIKLLPATFESKEHDKAKNVITPLINFEPSPESVLDYLIPKYIISTIYGAMVESSASESGSRRIAMENATDNADEMITTLKLVKNRARQAAITQEISEIVSGAEALS